MQQNHIVFTAGNGEVYALVSVFFFLFRTKLNGNTSLDSQKYSKFVAISKVSALVYLL